MYLAKKKAIKGSQNCCQGCRMKVLENEADALCPWCQERDARQSQLKEARSE